MALRMHEALGAAALLAVAAVPTLGQAPGSIPGVLAPSAAPELVQEGFVFTEGPVGTADGGLYFSDIRVSKIFYLDPGRKISMARENTNGASILLTPARGRWWRADRPTCTTSHLARGSRSCSTAASRDRTG